MKAQKKEAKAPIYVIDHLLRITPSGSYKEYDIYKTAKNGQAYFMASCRSEKAAKCIANALNRGKHIP